MINSAALPKVALSSPPSVGPVRSARCSVAVPISAASGRTATHAIAKISTGSAPVRESQNAAGAARKSTDQGPSTRSLSRVAGVARGGFGGGVSRGRSGALA